ncbi:MAG TPA: sarcosine oxidase subunit gamma family protein [Castellaniella sp.]|uniref:sarcosine oxidase subunit gamma n=1 Tax=Castellaniella sp. TaxID=1955812 RepID=UPI002EFEE651
MWRDQQTALVGLVDQPGASLVEGDQSKILLSEQRFPALINLRGDPARPAFQTAVQEACDISLPTRANSTSAGSDWLALWLGPDEWMLRSRQCPNDAAPTVHALEQYLAGQFFAVTDQSSGFSVIQLMGPCAAEVLNKGCPLDLHPRAFPVGDCAQSHYFKAHILIHRIEEQVWEIIVRRSFADVTARLLKDAMWEYLEIAEDDRGMA